MIKSFQEMTAAIQAHIREMAYTMWESAGRQQGMAMNYWLEAEREVLNTMQAAAERLMAVEASRHEQEQPDETDAERLAESGEAKTGAAETGEAPGTVPAADPAADGAPPQAGAGSKAASKPRARKTAAKASSKGTPKRTRKSSES
jgi:hypothetical protein